MTTRQEQVHAELKAAKGRAAQRHLDNMAERRYERDEQYKADRELVARVDEDRADEERERAATHYRDED